MKSYQIKHMLAVALCVFCLVPMSACKDDSSSVVGSSSVTDASSMTSGEQRPLTDLTVIPENTYDGAAIVCDDIVVAAGTTKVPYRVMLYNNPGYGFVGMRLFYDTTLKPYMDEERGQDEMEITTGDATQGFMFSCMRNEAQKMIGAAAFGAADCKSDGVMFTCYFDIPADAASGTVYEFSAEVVDFRPLEGENHKVEVIAGKITVQ